MPSPNSGANKPLPSVNVEFGRSGDEMTADKTRGMICNPIYTGVGPYPPLVTDEEWVRAAAQMIKESAIRHFLQSENCAMQNTLIGLI